MHKFSFSFFFFFPSNNEGILTIFYPTGHIPEHAVCRLGKVGTSTRPLEINSSVVPMIQHSHGLHG